MGSGPWFETRGRAPRHEESFFADDRGIPAVPFMDEMSYERGSKGFDEARRCAMASTFRRFDIDNSFWADCDVSDAARAGRIYHIERNPWGGSNSTPIAYYFVRWPTFAEEHFNRHWRVDCFVRLNHPLSPEPMQLGDALVAALVREQLCAEPIWMSAHRSEELDGKDFGEVFCDDQ